MSFGQICKELNVAVFKNAKKVGGLCMGRYIVLCTE